MAFTVAEAQAQDLAAVVALAAGLPPCGWLDPGPDDVPVPGYPGWFLPARLNDEDRAAWVADVQAVPYVTRLRIFKRMNDVHEYEHGHRHDAHLQPCYTARDVQ